MLGKGCPTLIVGCSISMPFDRFGPRRDIPRMYANVACGHPAFGEVLAFAFFKENKNVLIGLRVRTQKRIEDNLAGTQFTKSSTFALNQPKFKNLSFLYPTILSNVFIAL